MTQLLLPIALSILTAITAIITIQFELRHKSQSGKSRLTRAGKIVIMCHIIIFTFASSLIFTRVHEAQMAQKRQEVVDQWSRVPVSNLSINYVLNPHELKRYVDVYGALSYYPNVEMSLDFKEAVSLPPVYIYPKHEPKETGKISIQRLFKGFPKTVGELFGHSIKIRENDTRPFTMITAVNFYANAEVTKPFLTLSEVGHEYASAYYMRVWYPAASIKRLPSQHEGMRNHGPFVVWPDVLPQSSPFN
jgi:hypothetical protein